MSYKLEDIDKGDEIYFNRVGIENHDLYWEVNGFINGMIEVEVNAMGHHDKLCIDVKDIVRLQKFPK